MSHPLQFRVTGMHCAACEWIVADAVSQDSEVLRAEASPGNLTIELKEPGPADPWKNRWNARLMPLGYRLFSDGEDPRRQMRRETWAGWMLGLAVLAGFGTVQALGWVNLWTPDSLTWSGALILGLLASVSSCFALVGGLLVSYAAAVGRRSPAALGPGLTAFHLSRGLVFVLGGGILGWMGAELGSSLDLQRLLLTLAALVMTVLGLNLVGVRLSWGPKKSPVIGHARGLASWGTVGGGAALGALSFVLPCGFTQSVQFQALAAGGFVDGALLTLAFAAGTAPVLISVGWFLKHGLGGSRRAVILLAGGVVVLGLGLVQAWGALHLWGVRW